jgi:hypothetical protein
MFPNGLQTHALYNMDGRQWIEVIAPDRFDSPFFKRAIEKGQITLIPQDKLREFVRGL